MYDTAISQPCRSQRPTDFASGYMLEIATPAEEPNQIIEPPKPTAYARTVSYTHLTLPTILRV